jgi:hypothetical protein
MRSLAHHRNIGVFLLAALALVVLPTPTAAQGPGVRAGASVEPDQFYVGGHYESNALVNRLYFKPNAELGFGDNVTTFALNFEFLYKFPVARPWTLYAGGGPALNIYSFDRDRFGDDNSDARGGLNLLFGAETSRGLFFEMKVGAIDSPDLKFGVGYTWR